MGRNKFTILDKEQQQGMRKVCRLAREVLDIAAREIKPGVTTDHIDEVVHKACMERNVSRPMDNAGCPSTYTSTFKKSRLMALSPIRLLLITAIFLNRCARHQMK